MAASPSEASQGHHCLQSIYSSNEHRLGSFRVCARLALASWGLQSSGGHEQADHLNLCVKCYCGRAQGPAMHTGEAPGRRPREGRFPGGRSS